MINSCPLWDSNPVPSAYEANSLGIAPIDQISVGRGLPMFTFKINLDHVAD